jgi:hypothetical protein
VPNKFSTVQNAIPIIYAKCKHQVMGTSFSVFWILLIVIHLFMDTELHFHVSGFVSGQYGTVL